MDISQVCSNYFSGFTDLAHIRQNSPGKNALTALKIVSYATIVIPLAFAILKGAASLSNWAFTKKQPTPQDQTVAAVAAEKGVVPNQTIYPQNGALYDKKRKEFADTVDLYNEIMGAPADPENKRDRVSLQIQFMDEDRREVSETLFVYKDDKVEVIDHLDGSIKQKALRIEREGKELIVLLGNVKKVQLQAHTGSLSPSDIEHFTKNEWEINEEQPVKTFSYEEAVATYGVTPAENVSSTGLDAVKTVNLYNEILADPDVREKQRFMLRIFYDSDEGEMRAATMFGGMRVDTVEVIDHPVKAFSVKRRPLKEIIIPADAVTKTELLCLAAPSEFESYEQKGLLVGPYQAEDTEGYLAVPNDVGVEVFKDKVPFNEEAIQKIVDRYNDLSAKLSSSSKDDFRIEVFYKEDGVLTKTNWQLSWRKKMAIVEKDGVKALLSEAPWGIRDPLIPLSQIEDIQLRYRVKDKDYVERRSALYQQGLRPCMYGEVIVPANVAIGESLNEDGSMSVVFNPVGAS